MDLDMYEKSSRIYRGKGIFWLIVCLFVISGVLVKSQAQDSSSVPRSFPYKLKHVEADQAKAFLEPFGLASDINQIGNSNVLLVTSDSSILLRYTRNLLHMYDSKREYTVSVIIPNARQQDILDLAAVDDAIEGVKIGSFSEPPQTEFEIPAMIELHRNRIISIAPRELQQHIITTYLALLEEKQQAAVKPKAAKEQTPTPTEAVEETTKEQQQEQTQEDKAVEEAPEETQQAPVETEQEQPAPEKKPTEDDLFGEELLNILEGMPQEPTPQEQQSEQIQPAARQDQEEQPVKEDARFPETASLLEMLKDLEQQQPETEGIPEPEQPEAAVEPVMPEITATAQGPNKLRAFEIQNRDPQEIEQTLRNLMGGEDGITMIPDPASGNLLVRAPAPMLEEIAAVIASLDRKTETTEQKTQPMSGTIPIQQIYQHEDEQTQAAEPVNLEPEIESPDAELDTVLTLPQNVEITNLLELVGKQLGLNYMFDPAEVRGTVTLKIHDGKIKVGELYNLLESVLRFRGFVMSRRGDLVTIVKNDKALEIDPTLRRDTRSIKPGDVIVTSVFELDYITTESAQNLLTNMKLGVQITPIPETGTLIVTGYAYRMPRIEEVLEMVDVPGVSKVFKWRKLEYTLAEELLPKLETLASQLQDVTITVSEQQKQQPTRPTRGRPPQRSRPQPQQPQGQEAAAQAVYLDVDERTNRIFMIGTEDDIALVGELINALDVQKEDLRAIRQYAIENVDAEEVRNKLVELNIISGTVQQRRRTTSARGRSAQQQQAGQPAAPTPTAQVETSEGVTGEATVVILEATNSLLVNASDEQHEQIALIIAHVDSALEQAANPYVIYPLENQDPESMAEVLERVINETQQQQTDQGTVVTRTREGEDRVVIVPDENTFSIIVYASRKKQEQIAKLIETLDRRRPQVLIDVTLVEITNEETFQYDLEVVSAIPDLTSTSGVISGVGTTTISDIISKIDAAPEQSKFLEGSVKSGDAKGFYADEQIHALLTLMQTKEYGRVLAQPKILVNDNQEGMIQTENTLYVARTTETVIPDAGGASTESTVFEEYVSGIELLITPHISDGDLLRLEIEMNRSTQDATGQLEENDPPPAKTQNTVTTTVTVPDKSTIILGGILQLNQSRGGGKVPLFGDLPLVGGLFREIDNTNNQSKIYIFVKALISRPSPDEAGLPELEEISARKRRAYEQTEIEFQHYEDWPGLESEPMVPLKALEYE